MASRKIRFLAAVAAIAWLSCMAAAAIAGAAESPLRVAVLYWSTTIPGQVAMRAGLEAEVERINRQAQSHGDRPPLLLDTYVAGDGAAGIERQIRQFRAAIAQHPDAILVQPTDNAALAEPLREANRLGIPVVAYDQYISGGDLTAYITSDNRQAGYLDGEYIAAQYPDDHVIALVLVEYPHVSSTVERLNGFLDALREHRQRYRIVGAYKAVQPEEGRRAGQRILADFPDPGSIDVVFTVNDGGGLAVVDELAAAGRHEIMVASIDGDPASVANIRAGRLTHIDTAQFCGALGATALRTAHAVAEGKSVARRVLVPVFPVTRDTLHRYPGWLGDIPGPFDKPWPSHQPQWRGDIQELR